MKRLVLALLLAGLPLALTAGAATSAMAAEEGEAEESASATAQPTREGSEDVRSCRTIAKQIVHFEAVKVRAEERGNEAWEQGTADHIDRLRMLQLQRCPEDVPPSKVERIADLLKKAGRIAATAASLGAF